MKKVSRRNFLKVSGAMAAAGALAACGGSGAASTSTAASAAAAGEDKFASLGDFTMTVGHAQPEGNPRFVSMEQFAADVAEATNGHVKIEVYGNGQLGTEKEMLEQVVAGTVQGMRGGQFDFSPRLLMFTLPFLTNTRAQVTALLQSDLAQKVCAEAEGETGTVIINLCDAGGYRQFSNSKHPIKAPADLKGLKMRTNGMKTIDMTFQAMGATTNHHPVLRPVHGPEDRRCRRSGEPLGQRGGHAPTFITMLPQRVWNGAYSELMIAMPLFMLAGELMNTGGITQRIINFCMELLRPIRGGLGEVNIVASMIFGGISGSSVADTSALGSILIPAMEKEGYPPEASAGITVASSTMGMIIPPSTPMIVYSMISGASVGALFVAGAVPGILIGLTQLVLVYIISAKKGWHPEKIKFDGKRAAKRLLSGIPALIMPLFIIICVSFGVCTASESAGVAVLYSMLVGFFVYKELTWKGVWEALKKTLISSSSIMLIIGFTTIFTWVLTMQKVLQTVGAFFMSLNMPAWAIALIFDVLILMIGTFIDVSPAILLLTPILLPVMVQYGFSPLQFGAMMITGLAIGLVTPPVGMCLNACNKINRMPIIEIFKGAAPYVICNVIVLISISLWGPLTTALPQLLGYSIF